MEVKYEACVYDADTGELLYSRDDFESIEAYERFAEYVEVEKSGGNAYVKRFTYGVCCGETLDLSAFTNTCARCGRDYNSMGQELAPRSQWGEETGEPWYAGDLGYADPDSAFDEYDY